MQPNSIFVRGDNIQYVHTDSNHTDPLYRITPAKLIETQNYDREHHMLTIACRDVGQNSSMDMIKRARLYFSLSPVNDKLVVVHFC